MVKLKKEKKEFSFHDENCKEKIFFCNEKDFIRWKESEESEKKNFFLVKDNFWTQNIKTTASSFFLENFFSFEDSTVVKLLKSKNYSLLGKASLDEFACGGTGLFSCNGKISNPHDKKRISGGSSSGSVVSVSKDIVSFSIGHDAGDSVRRPSSYCGVIGFKPSYGSISRYGIIPMASSLDTIGIISKSINIIEKIFNILSKFDHKDITTFALKKIKRNEKFDKEKKIKIAFIQGIENLIPKNYSILYKKFVDVICEEKKFLVEKIRIPKKIRESLQISYLIICSSEITSHLSSLKGITYGFENNCKENFKTIKEKRSSKIGKWAKERIVIGNYFLKNKELIEKANLFRSFLVEWMERIFRKYEFLLFPGTQNIAPKISSFKKKENIKKSNWVDNLLLIGNIAGNPSINIPLGETKNMPVSINIDSFWRNEKRLIRFSKDITKIIIKNKNFQKEDVN